MCCHFIFYSFAPRRTVPGYHCPTLLLPLTTTTTTTLMMMMMMFFLVCSDFADLFLIFFICDLHGNYVDLTVAHSIYPCHSVSWISPSIPSDAMQCDRFIRCNWAFSQIDSKFIIIIANAVGYLIGNERLLNSSLGQTTRKTTRKNEETEKNINNNNPRRKWPHESIHSFIRPATHLTTTTTIIRLLLQFRPQSFRCNQETKNKNKKSVASFFFHFVCFFCGIIFTFIPH